MTWLETKDTKTDTPVISVSDEDFWCDRDSR
jgi:hypothetical protein